MTDIRVTFDNSVIVSGADGGGEESDEANTSVYAGGGDGSLAGYEYHRRSSEPQNEYHEEATGRVVLAIEESFVAPKMSFWRRFQRHWRVAVLRISTRHEWPSLDENVWLWPIRYQDRELEKKFANEYCNKSMRSVVPRIGSIGLATSLLLWLLFGAAAGADNLYNNSTVCQVLFHLGQATNVVVYVILALSKHLDWILIHLERFVYLSFAMIITVGFVWTTVIVETITMPAATNFEEFTTEDIYLLATALEIRVWIYQPQAVTDFMIFLFLNVSLRSRTKWSVLVHGYSLLLRTVHFALQIVKYKYNVESRGVLCAEFVLYACIVSGSFFCRCIFELSDRSLYLQKHRNALLLEETRSRLIGQKKKNAADFEKLMELILDAEKLVQSVAIVSRLTEAYEADKALADAITLLEHSENLYSFRRPSQTEATAEEQLFDEFFCFYQPMGRQKSIRQFAVAPTMIGSRFDTFNREDYRSSTKYSTLSAMAYYPGAEIEQRKRHSVAEEDPEVANFKTPKLQLFSFLVGKVGFEFNTPILEYAKQTNYILLEVGSVLLNKYAEDLMIQHQTIANFLFTLESRYLRNPYHNATHGASVGHFTCCLARMMGLYESHLLKTADEVAVCVAALGHDVGHPARNNAFFVNTYDTLAIAYNDASVLENFHACLTFHLLDKPGCNVFVRVMPEEFRSIRLHIVEMILATDMKLHFESVSRFRVRRCARDFDQIHNEEDLWLTFKQCIKLADLGHSCLDWDQHVEWSYRVVEEFYQQGDAETRMGFPKSPLCDRDTHSNFAKSQKGFIEFVVQPFVEELREACGRAAFEEACSKRVKANRGRWEALHNDGNELEIPERIGQMKTGLGGITRTLIDMYRGFIRNFESNIGVTTKSTATQTKLTLKGMEMASLAALRGLGVVGDAPSPPDNSTEESSAGGKWPGGLVNNNDNVQGFDFEWEAAGDSVAAEEEAGEEEYEEVEYEEGQIDLGDDDDDFYDDGDEDCDGDDTLTSYDRTTTGGSRHAPLPTDSSGTLRVFECYVSDE